MKLFVVILLVSSFSYAGNDAEMMAKLKKMENRIKELESKNSQNSQNTLKVEDMGNKEVDSKEMSEEGQGTSGETPEMSDSKKKEIMDTLKQYKSRRAEEMKILEELDSEDP